MKWILCILTIFQLGGGIPQAKMVKDGPDSGNPWLVEIFGNRTIHVPDNAPTIQEGIDRTMNGDTVLVSPGTYNETLNMKGKAILLSSAAGPDSTIISGDGENPVITLESGEDTTTVIEGFTITGGSQGICITESGATIKGNIICENSGDLRGGGIGGLKFVPQTDLTIIDNEIFHNSAFYGGGIYCPSSENAQIIRNRIYENEASGSYGGGIYAHYGKFVIQGNEIFNNSSNIGAGMEIFGGEFNLIDNVISDNTGGSGVGVYDVDMGNIESNIIEGNDEGGIGIGGSSDYVIIQENEIRFNIRGGIYVGGSPHEVHILKNIIEYNTAVDGGGVIINQNTVLKYNIIMNNLSTGGGGEGAGIWIWDNFEPGSSEISNNLIAGNVAESGPGGGIFVYWGGDPVITNNTIVGNSALRGSGIHIDESYADITNNIIVNNEGGYGIECSAGSASLTYNDVWGNDPGDYYNCGPGVGSISEDPCFYAHPVQGYEYLLQSDSPCIDAGDPAIEDALYDWHPKWPDWYPDGARSDMGAYGGPGNIDWLR